MSLVTANNRFGLELYHALLKEGAGRNLLISPTSVALALEMTYNGAAGQTREAMARALEIQGMSLDAMNRDNAKLVKELNSGKKGVRLNVANSLWIASTSQMKAAFLERNRTFYHAEIGDLAGAPANVNAWVSRETHGKIQAILNASDVPKGPAEAILANAVYFKGAWLRPFRPEATTTVSFHRQDGSNTSCKMMSTTNLFDYVQGDHFQAVRLPYGASSPSHVSMILFLPDEGHTLAEFQAQMTAANWNAWMRKMAAARGTVEAPRFRFETDADLRAPLSAMGMGIAFDPRRADFSGMSMGALVIHKVKHKTFIDVDEKGTEAAAATAVVMTRAAARAGHPFKMTFNRPFACAIGDDDSGAILFLGSVLDPLVK